MIARLRSVRLTWPQIALIAVRPAVRVWVRVPKRRAPAELAG